ncbi:hypothetical protein MPLA_850004 [Mesorhizobium sp. ORS 3359]|nr:hypothetical protein MPLA_850004 [Mesorhizobium sp. ORS 3359]
MRHQCPFGASADVRAPMRSLLSHSPYDLVRRQLVKSRRRSRGLKGPLLKQFQCGRFSVRNCVKTKR